MAAMAVSTAATASFSNSSASMRRPLAFSTRPAISSSTAEQEKKTRLVLRCGRVWKPLFDNQPTGTIVGDLPTFTWSAVPQAGHYTIKITVSFR